MRATAERDYAAGRSVGELNAMQKLVLTGAEAAVVVGALVIGIGQAPAICAQSRARPASRPESRPEFEVASVRIVRYPVPVHPYRLDISHGTLRIDAVPLRFIIALAYAGQEEHLGGPSWIDDERYDIQAKAGGPNATRGQIHTMLQDLLVDRFRLAFHEETRRMPVYELIVGKDGPKLKKAKDDEQQNISRAGSAVTFRKWAMTGLAHTLSGVLGRPVRNETGLTGTYDFTLEWSAESSGDSGPSIFTAVQEQLGLKLEPGKGPVRVMVIDHVEHATPN